jgi:hypothetical protein
VKILKGLGLCVAFLGASFCALLVGTALYDLGTKVAILSSVKKVLPTGASADEMRCFLERHAEYVSMDDTFDHKLRGAPPQKMLDRWLLDRRVLIVLNTDEHHRFAFAEIDVNYTFL